MPWSLHGSRDAGQSSCGSADDCHAVTIFVDGYGDGRKVKTREVCTKPKSHKSKTDTKQEAAEAARKAAEEAERAAEKHAREQRRGLRMTVVQQTVAGRIGRDVEEFALDVALHLVLDQTREHAQPRRWEAACEVLDIDLFDIGDTNLPARAAAVRDRLEGYAKQSISHRTRTIAVLAAVMVDESIEPESRYYGYIDTDLLDRYRTWLTDHGWTPAPEETPIAFCRQCEITADDGCGERHPGGDCSYRRSNLRRKSTNAASASSCAAGTAAERERTPGARRNARTPSGSSGCWTSMKGHDGDERPLAAACRGG